MASSAVWLFVAFAGFQLKLLVSRCWKCLTETRCCMKICHTSSRGTKSVAQNQKRGRPFGGEKGSALSVRVSSETKRELEYFARKNGLKVSREVESRLKFSFGRYGRPPHIADL